MLIDFEKWHGCKNDFIVLKINYDPLLISSLQKSASRLCSRTGDGIGADGLIVLAYNSTNKTWQPDELFIINSDGSLAGNCGNGIRCAAMSLYNECKNKNISPLPEHITFNVKNHKIEASIHERKNSPKESIVSLFMGEPKLNDQCTFYPKLEEEIKRIEDQLKVENLTKNFGCCQIGNDHIVIYTDKNNLRNIEKIGTAIQKSPHWDGINFHLAYERPPKNSEIKFALDTLGVKIEAVFETKTFERGAGLTPACGSGACAVAALSLHSGFYDRENWIGVSMPGGVLLLQQKSPEDSICLAGAAEIVFRGIFDL